MSLKLLTRLIRINPDYAGCVSSFNDEGLKLLTHERGLAPTDQSEHPSMINHQQTPLSAAVSWAHEGQCGPSHHDQPAGEKDGSGY